MNTAERVLSDAHDRAINDIFGCGLALASVLSRPDIDEEIARRLFDVLERLDTAVSALRGAAFEALVAAERDTRPESPARAIRPANSVANSRAPRERGLRHLCHFADDAFAYAMRQDDFRAADHVRHFRSRALAEEWHPSVRLP